MNFEKTIDDVLSVAANVATALLPGALGAIISQSWERGLTLAQRVLAVAAGCVISYYVTAIVTSLLHVDPFASQSIGFVIGLFAFKAAPGFQRSAIAFAAEIPGLIKGWLSKKGSNE